MATDFPNSPANGATHTFGGITYTYSTSVGAWTAGSSAGGASVTVSETAPSSPAEGDLWFDPSILKTFVYYNDGTANQWVQSNPTGSGGGASGGASVTVSETSPTSPSAGDLWWSSSEAVMYIYYTDTDSSQWVSTSTPGADGATGSAGASASVAYANLASFPSTPTEGDIAYAQDTNALYVYDGSEWDRISSGSDESPRVTTEPPASHALNSDGTTSTVTMVAEDPEGFDIEYEIKYNTSGGALPDQLASATTINQSTGVYTFTPTTTEANAGTFNARLTASDGNRVTIRTVPFSITFSEDIVFDASEPGISTTLTNTTTGWSQSSTTPGSNMAQSNTLQTGKRYFEMYVTGDAGGPMIGIYPESNTDPGHNDTDGPAVYVLNGNTYPTATYASTGLTLSPKPYTFMIAFDTDARKVWFGFNGSWSTGSGDPTSGTGYTVGGTGGFTLCLGNGTSTGQLTSNILLSTNLTYSIPAGFQSQ